MNPASGDFAVPGLDLKNVQKSAEQSKPVQTPRDRKAALEHQLTNRFASSNTLRLKEQREAKQQRHQLQQ